MPTMTLEQFALHIARCAAVMPAREHQALKTASSHLAAAARGYIGHYQTSRIGPFKPWPQLADSTLTGGTSPAGYHYKGKVELGYAPPDNPLLRQGDLRTSIEHTVAGRSAIVGSNNPVARYQEFGTQQTSQHNAIPPRPFIGRALAEFGRREARNVANVVFRPLLTGRF